MKKLTANQYEVLCALQVWEENCEDDTVWARPMDIGGYDGSHHSKTLGQLVDKGLVKKYRRQVGVSGGSNLYAITRNGYLKLIDEAQSVKI